MSNFILAATKILDIEGGYSNNPDDYGGETKYGIAKKYYPEVDITTLTQAEALAIYKQDYWDKFRGDLIDNQKIADEMLDIAVNMNWERAARFLQDAINHLDKEKVNQLKVDGLVGPKTLKAVNLHQYPEAIVKHLNGCQFEHYHARVHEDLTQETFYRGWLRRI